MENLNNNTSDGSGPTLEYLGELVLQGFRNLKRKCESPCTLTQDATRILPPNGVNSREFLCNRLNSTLLPLLKDQLTAMLNLLGPASMKEEPKSKFRRVLEIQPELDYNITQIHSAFLALCPESEPDSDDQTNDQHLKHLKAYRLLEFKKKFESALQRIRNVLQTAFNYVELWRYPGLRGELYKDYEGQTKDVVKCIELAIQHSKRSEMDAIEDCATRAVGAIGRQLGHLIGLINPAAPRRYPFLSRPLSHQPIINLATKATPLIKLTQLFFKKLSKHGIMNCRTLPSFTPMNSYQLERLCQSAENVSPCLEELLISLGELDTTLEDRRLDTLLPIITKSAEDTASTLSASLLSVVLYLIPLIDSLPEQNYYQSWFATWNTQINIAVRNVVQVARDLRDLQYDSEDDSD